MWTLLNKTVSVYPNSKTFGSVNLNQQSTVKTAQVHAHHYAQLLYTIQHTAVLISSLLSLLICYLLEGTAIAIYGTNYNEFIKYIILLKTSLNQLLRTPKDNQI